MISAAQQFVSDRLGSTHTLASVAAFSDLNVFTGRLPFLADSISRSNTNNNLNLRGRWAILRKHNHPRTPRSHPPDAETK